MTEKLLIFDTTLRDGEQSPGCSMHLDEKLRMAAVLDKMGVDIIEAGFPVASKGDFESVNEIAKTVKNATVCGLARAKDIDIEAAGEAIKPAKRQRIHTFISTSPLHMKYKLKMSEDDVLEAIKYSVEKACTYTDDVEWSAEDGSRTERDYLCKAVETAITAGATTINIPDTVGYTTPDEYADIFKMLINRVPNIDKAILSVHCHDDLGLAVANSLSGVMAGARQVECTINGIGERAGNAALEEVVMALRTRNDVMPFETNIETTMITRASRTLSSITGFQVQPNKAIVGANAFAHESGIHQDGVLKHTQTYEIMTPESVGLKESALVLGKHSGRNAFKTKLKELGYEFGDNRLNDLFSKFKDLADKKKTLFEDDIIALVDNERLKESEVIKFESLRVLAGSKEEQKAELALIIDGEEVNATAGGNGPVDALFNAIRELLPHDDATLLLYQVHAVTKGTDALAEVTVKLLENDREVLGHGANVDVLVASCLGYIDALNKLIGQRAETIDRAEKFR
jgi:2-isopropylmalate synthase